VYGDAASRGAEGQWGADADAFMRDSTNALQKHLAARKVVEAVMGQPDWLANPFLMVCPFKSDSCTNNGRRRLNNFSSISHLHSHWGMTHRDNPAAQLLMSRFKVANKNKKDVPAALAARSE
jgi:hypothetical protein